MSVNYLSHFLLSDGADEAIHMGNFLGDVISKKLAEDLSPELYRGVAFHRFVDTFTDNHPLVLQGKQLLYEPFGKYASVILDVYFDFLLIDSWHDYAHRPLDDFLDNTYDFLGQHLDWVPMLAQKKVNKMLAARWMDGYLTPAGREALFGRLAKRAKYDKNFHLAVGIFQDKKSRLEPIFKAFFPVLAQASDDWIAKN